MSKMITDNQKVLDVLNKLPVHEMGNSEDAYVLVEITDAVKKEMIAVGVDTETLVKYGDKETFCKLSLAYGEGYANHMAQDGSLHYKEKALILGLKSDYELAIVKEDGDIYVYLDHPDGYTIETKKLEETDKQALRDILEEADK